MAGETSIVILAVEGDVTTDDAAARWRWLADAAGLVASHVWVTPQLAADLDALGTYLGGRDNGALASADAILSIGHPHLAIAAHGVRSPASVLLSVETSATDAPPTAEVHGGATYARMLDVVDRHLVTVFPYAREMRTLLPARASKIEYVQEPLGAPAGAPLVSDEPGSTWHFYADAELETDAVADARETIAAFAAFVADEEPKESRLVVHGVDAHHGQFLTFARDLGLEGSVSTASYAWAAHEQLGAADVVIALSPFGQDASLPKRALIAGARVVARRTPRTADALDVAESRGVVALVPESVAASEIVDAVRRVLTAPDAGATPAVSADLLARFGADSLAPRLARLVAGGPWSAPDEGAETVVVIASLPQGRRRAHRTIREALGAGMRVIYVTDSDEERDAVADGVELVDVSRRMGRTPSHIAGNLVSRTVPHAASSVARGIGRTVQRGPGPAKTVGRKAITAGKKLDSLAARVHTSVIEHRVYGWMGGSTLAKFALAARPDLVDEAICVVVSCDERSTYLAWLLGKEAPEADLYNGIAPGAFTARAQAARNASSGAETETT